MTGTVHSCLLYTSDADTEAKKKDLFAKVRTGQVRVLLGSTQKMGAGTNVQDRLVAVHLSLIHIFFMFVWADPECGASDDTNACDGGYAGCSNPGFQAGAVLLGRRCV